MNYSRQDSENLTIESVTDVVADHLLACSDDQFPLVRTLRLSGSSSVEFPDTVVPIAVSVSKRPVEELSIVPGSDDVDFNIIPEVARALGECLMLGSLVIRLWQPQSFCSRSYYQRRSSIKQLTPSESN